MAPDYEASTSLPPATTGNKTMHSNHLIDETSPYLQQHAHNPVDWYPWSDKALQKARDEDKPILLSIGYSACHWCHVMEHESFEDESVAAIMNERYICIKVDREERPDLDKIYQLAHQMLTQRPGGWPLNVFLAPDNHAPFFAGTYFPKEPRHGLPAFPDLLRRVASWFHENRDQLKEQEAAIRSRFQSIEPGGHTEEIRPDVLDQALNQLQQQYDPVHAGFGGAPKFPHPTNLEFLLHYTASHPQNTSAPDMLRHSLQAMASGGIYDQLGGGFCRYATDELWMIPHFEKMLYDNAQLMPLYVDAWRIFDDEVFRRVAEQTGEWVLREMQSPDGGYYSTLDADSEGEEGKFYVFSADEFRQLLSDDEWAVVRSRYQIKGKPNFEGKAWHLHIFSTDEEVAKKTGLPENRVRELIASAHEKLFAHREKRIHPGRDEKNLTSWNGMMIKAMAHTGRLLDRRDFIDSAERAMAFIQTTMLSNGRLLATHKDGKTHLNAYVDDYVLLIDAALELLQTRWQTSHLNLATTLADKLLGHFEDRENGGFYFTSDDHEALLHRHKPTADDATPSGNGVAAQVLLKLGHLLGESRYLDAAERTLKWLYASIASYPSAHGSGLIAIEEYLSPGRNIILRGNPADLDAWSAKAALSFHPQKQVYAIPDDEIGLPGVLAARQAHNGPVAYVCSGHQCSAPLTDINDL
ncbi:MAG: thioredoxin domain-containing protein [Gammaproteobacteria bacterium]|nr:MAG: thioredoxin domain-containing protein [Gammaproteobacteria bacterium]